MRKIELDIINALRNQDNLNKGNTSVQHSQDIKTPGFETDITGAVYLHGNLIARFNRAVNELTIYDAGWTSNTTKSRLNALLNEFAPAYGICQNKFQWFLTDRGQDDWRHWGDYATFRAGSLVEFG